MRRFFRGLTAWLCAAALCFTSAGALAEFSPRYAAMTAEGGIEAELCISFETLAKLSEGSLAVVNDWLSRMRLRLALQETAARSQNRLSLTLDGEEALAVSTLTQSDYTLTVFSPSGGAYLTSPDAPDALSLLAEDQDGLPNLAALPAVYAQWAPALYPLLAQITTPKASKTATSIKNAAASAAYENYILTAEEMNGAWPQILDALLPALKGALAGQPRLYAQAEELLRALTFSGECRFKRFLDKEGGDMGLQFTGRAARGEDERKVTLFGGYTPGKGGYISLSLPAVSGKNNFKATLTGKLSEKNAQRALTLEGTYTRAYAGETQTASLDVSLKNAIQDENEKWSGKVTVETKEKGIKSTWILTPDLAFTGSGLQGQVGIRQKKDGDQVLKAVLSLSLKGMGEIAVPEAAAAKDLRGMEESQARAVTAGETSALTRVFMGLIAALPEETRSVLTHDLRTEAWMTAPSAPLPEADNKPGAEESPWIVEEEEEQ